MPSCTPTNQLRAATLLLAAFALPAQAEKGTAGLEFFENRIRPVFVEHCHECHSATAKKVKGDLKLDTREGFLKGGTDGVIVVPGEPEKSRLIHAVRYEDEDTRMPPKKDGRKKLPDVAIADLVAWVKMGAPYPETSAAVLAKNKAARPWAFDPVRNPPPPAVKNTAWPATSIDPFILAKLEERGLQPAAPADKRTLIRRATYDLTGLPPTPDEIAAFLADESPRAYATLVDRLLASPRYGERWGRHWLDIVRYADTAGDTADYPVGLAWRYRNYVIDAFNADKPYDEFLREQIAGDVIAEQGPRERYAERLTATGFLAISRRFGFDSEKYQHLMIQDTIDTLGQTVLGLSLGCARCHDHKFDPISMRDYYALYGIFDSTRYPFPGSEQKNKSRSMVPLAPAAEAQPIWREYEKLVAARLAAKKQGAPPVVLRSLHDPDGDFEMQKDAAGGSYGVIVAPWMWEGKLSVTGPAQSPFKNFYPFGSFGVNIAGGDSDYRLAQSLHPRRTAEKNRVLHVNLDFRPAAPGAKGLHRFWLGAQAGAPAVELFISAEAVFVRAGEKMESVAALKPKTWHNLQLTLDLGNRTFGGTVSQTDDATTFSDKAFTAGWPGVIDYVALDSTARDGAALPGLELDNFGTQPEPIAPASTAPPVPPASAEAARLNAELQKLTGVEGDLEDQKNGAAPAGLWNAGSKSVVKISADAQSPFQNIVGAGKLGVEMPNRAPYDGFGLRLATPWAAKNTERLFASVDFRCGKQDAGGEGTWHFYIGHGAGKAAVEFCFNGSEFFARTGETWAAVAKVRPGEWHQLQLTLNLKDKTCAGTLATADGSTQFTAGFAAGWDGTIDYSYIDSVGNRPGARPALSADNFIFRESAFPPPDGKQLAENEARRAKAANLRKQLAALNDEAKKTDRDLNSLLEDGPCEMTYGVVEGTPHHARMQLRGEPDRPGDEVPRGFISSLGGGPLPPGTQGSGRLELAQWLTRPDNPLAARVMVNRIWQYHFGRGLVMTSNDFGTRGQAATHPELLDHLATKFVQGGWSVKGMHRAIMLSATYRQGSIIPERNAGALAEHHSTFPRRRISAEEMRDSILAISGELDLTPARGHPFPSPLKSAFTQHMPFSAVYDHNQRSVYLMTQRIKRHPFLALFDGPDPNASTADRRNTTVPTQALYFLNAPFVHEKAGKGAALLLAARTDEAQRIELAWLLTTGRPPTGAEQSEAAAFLAAYRAELTASGQKDIELAALSAYVRTLFGSNEFLHLD